MDDVSFFRAIHDIVATLRPVHWWIVAQRGFAAIGTDRVGQIVNLRPIGNPPYSESEILSGRLPIGRRLPTCPTRLVCDRLNKDRRGAQRNKDLVVQIKALIYGLYEALGVKHPRAFIVAVSMIFAVAGWLVAWLVARQYDKDHAFIVSIGPPQLRPNDTDNGVWNSPVNILMHMRLINSQSQPAIIDRYSLEALVKR